MCYTANRQKTTSLVSKKVDIHHHRPHYTSGGVCKAVKSMFKKLKTCTIFEKSFRTQANRKVFSRQLFRVLLNFHECFYTSLETQRTCFLFLFENKKTSCLLRSSKRIFSLHMPLLHQQLILVLCFYQARQKFQPISACILWGYFFTWKQPSLPKKLSCCCPNTEIPNY